MTPAEADAFVERLIGEWLRFKTLGSS
jgi:hypothetical protein